MDEILHALADAPAMLMALIFVPMALLLTGFAIWIGCRTAVLNTRQREQTRREVAAYVAEGSISAEDAEKILSPSPWYATMIGAAGWRGATAKDRPGPRHA